ncbi:MAG: hypothetical protein ABFC78_09340 [Methanoregula sp.]
MPKVEFMKIVFSAEEKQKDDSGLIPVPEHLTITVAASFREGFEVIPGTRLHNYAKTLIQAVKAASEARSDEEKTANREEIRAMIRKIAEEGHNAPTE